jgi:hypothetical protein
MTNTHQTTDLDTGWCPECPPGPGDPVTVYNAGRDHWGVCHTHRTRWWIGFNLFSGWRDETEDQQRERLTEIEDYRDVIR